MIRRVDLGICPAYDYEGDGPVAVVLPGAMLGGMPSVWYAFEPLLAVGWRVVLVWDEFLDRSQDHWAWTAARAEAAAAWAGGADLIVGKSLGVYGVARSAAPGVALTPTLVDPDLVDALRSRPSPTLLVGGTDDEAWDGEVARGLSPHVLELEGADHALAWARDAPRIGEAVASFSAGLRA